MYYCILICLLSYKMPHLSIITVLFNPIKNGRQAMLLQAIDSVNQQKNADFEHIIIDGASTDGTVDLLEQLKIEGKITTYISEPDKGIYDAMNKGAYMANGDYIGFLNSDDYYCDLEGFSKILSCIQHYDYLYSPVDVADEKENISGQFKPTPNRFLTKMPFAHQSLIIKKEIFSHLKGFDISFKLAADYDFIMRMMFEKYKGFYLKDILSVFRLGGISDTNIHDGINEKIGVWQKNFGIADYLKTITSKTLPIKILFRLFWQYPYLYKALLTELFRALRKIK